MIKKIISIFIVFSMVFSISAISVAQNIALPQNYNSLSKEAKITVLKTIIAQVQERIQVIVNKKKAEQYNGFPLSTKVVLNAIDKIDSDFTETGKIDFSFLLKGDLADYADMKYNVQLDFKNINYRVSSDWEDLDIHIDGKYSLKYYLDGLETKKILERDAGSPEAKIVTGLIFKDGKFDYLIEDDYFSIDFVMKKNNLYIKVSGFDKATNDLISFYDKIIPVFIENDKNLSKDNVLEIEGKIEEIVELTKNTFFDKWILIENFNKKESFEYNNTLKAPMIPGIKAMSNNKDVYYGIESNSNKINSLKKDLKEFYIKNPFLSFSNNCQESYVSKTSCLYNVKIDYDGVKKLILEKEGVSVKSRSNIEKVFEFIENQVQFKIKFSVNSNNEIDGRDIYFNFNINEKDLMKYTNEENPENITFEYALKTSYQNKINYVSNVRNIDSAVDIEVLGEQFEKNMDNYKEFFKKYTNN